MRLTQSLLAGTLAVAVLPLVGHAQEAKRASPTALYDLVVRGASCKQFAGSEALWRCEYIVGERLKFSIKDEGNGVHNIAFRHSDINDDFYAVMYGGCVAVVPALKHPPNYGADYVAYVAPANGRVYRDLKSCKATK